MLKTLMPSLTDLINADYKAIKNAETEQIIAQLLMGYTGVQNPQLMQISGIPGAGKSTYCATHIKPNFLYLSFDKIMLMLKGYQNVLASEGIVAAYQRYEMTARIIGYEVLRRAINKKLNILFEHSGTNNAHLELFKNLPKRGYKVMVNAIVCDIGLAINRAKERAEKTHRYVPEQLIIERAQNFEKYMSSYQKLSNQVTFLDGANNFMPLKKI